MTSRHSRRRPLADTLPAFLLALSMLAPAAPVRAADPPAQPKADAPAPGKAGNPCGPSNPCGPAKKKKKKTGENPCAPAEPAAPRKG
ncbi:MAG TPA: hypothetical protein PK359_20745 [Burkholderiaceae bacterium]|nr:hypothetical protein [Burkholderiaceae bacterium]